MYKLILLIVFSFISPTLVKAQNRLLFVGSGSDTAHVSYTYSKDTAIIFISFYHLYKSNDKKILSTYKIKFINKGSLEKPQFIYFDKRPDSSIYMRVAKDSIYFRKLPKTRKAIIAQMIEVRDPFIYNGKSNYYCLQNFNLQKDDLYRSIKWSFNQKYGLSAFNVREEDDSTNGNFIENFKLINIDGEDVKLYMNRLCKK